MREHPTEDLWQIARVANRARKSAGGKPVPARDDGDAAGAAPHGRAARARPLRQADARAGWQHDAGNRAPILSRGRARTWGLRHDLPALTHQDNPVIAGGTGGSIERDRRGRRGAQRKSRKASR